MVQPSRQQQQPIGYPQYVDSTAAFKKAMRDTLIKMAILTIILGIVVIGWGLFGAPQSKVSPELEMLGSGESRLVTVICSPCDIGAAKAVVGNGNYVGSSAKDRLIVKAGRAQISQLEEFEWVQYIAE